MVKLAIFCDGTWNGLRMPELTNVARLARSVRQQWVSEDKTVTVPQMVFYDEGVGVTTGVSRTNDRLESILGGAFGSGLDRKIEEAYRFIVLNYQPPHDELYIFGFSRGAYTARSLCGLIRKCGILRRECLNNIPNALKLYRDRTAHPSGPECQEFRRLYAHKEDATGSEDLVATETPTGKQGQLKAEQDRLKANQERLIGIRYLGLWDTVGSMGVPDRFFWLRGFNRKYQFHDTNASSLIQSLRHAIASDEDRRVFSATPFSNIRQLNIRAAQGPFTDGQTPPAIEGSTEAKKDLRPYQQKWFPGDHGAVGGGNPQLGLSSAALLWVADGAIKAGLALNEDKGGDLDIAGHAALPTADWRVGNSPGTVRSRWAPDLLGLIGGYRARPYAGAEDEIHDSARLRWTVDPTYGPKPLQPFSHREITPLHRKVELVIGPLFRLLLMLGLLLGALVLAWVLASLSIDLSCLFPKDGAKLIAKLLEIAGGWLGSLISPCCKVA